MAEGQSPRLWIRCKKNCSVYIGPPSPGKAEGFFTRVLQGAKQQLIVIQEGSGCYNEVRLVTSWGFAAYQLQQFHSSPWSFRKFFGAKKRWNPRILVNVHPVDAEIQIPILTLRCKQKPNATFLSGSSFCAAGVNFFWNLKQKRWNHGSQLSCANMTAPLSWSELRVCRSIRIIRRIPVLLSPRSANMVSQQSTERISRQYSTHTVKY